MYFARLTKKDTKQGDESLTIAPRRGWFCYLTCNTQKGHAIVPLWSNFLFFIDLMRSQATMTIFHLFIIIGLFNYSSRVICFEVRLHGKLENFQFAGSSGLFFFLSHLSDTDYGLNRLTINLSNYMLHKFAIVNGIGFIYLFDEKIWIFHQGKIFFHDFFNYFFPQKLKRLFPSSSATSVGAKKATKVISSKVSSGFQIGDVTVPFKEKFVLLTSEISFSLLFPLGIFTRTHWHMIFTKALCWTKRKAFIRLQCLAPLTEFSRCSLSRHPGWHCHRHAEKAFVLFALISNSN